MITKILKWGNSLSVRLPKSFTKELDLVENSLIEIKTEEDKIIILPLNQKEYRIEDLVSKISEDNIHDEIETGQIEGKEIW
jgi:antitoxin MazE